MKPNNLYYRDIAEKLNDTTYDKFYSSMYYMRQILLAYGQSYDRIQSSNKYCKDWYQLATEETPSGHKYNLWYLRRIAKEYDADFDMTSNENQCLQSILANISLSTTVRLVAEPSTQQYLGNIVLTATVLDEDREPVEDATVTFYDGTSSLGTETTGATGLASITVNNLSIGSHTLKAEYDGHTGSTQVTVTLIPTTLSLSASSSELYYGQTITLTGTSNIGASKTVKLYDGDTYIKDVTTGSGGSISTTITDAVVGLHNYNVRYDGDATHTTGESSNAIVNVLAKILTNLSISVPLDLHYGDSFNISGTLEDEDGNKLTGKAVYLYVGSTSVANVNTDSNGVASFTRSPVATGNHTFKLVYNGDTSHNNCESATASRIVQKETTVVDTTLPVNGAVIQEAFEVAGTLFEDDGVAMSGKTVYMKKGDTTLATFTTLSDGSFGDDDVPVTGLSDGVNTITFIYEGDENYASSSKTYDITYATYNDMSLTATDGVTSDPCILSYADTDYVKVTAQLLNGSSPIGIGNVPITFGVYLKSDDSLISGTQQTINTNSSGQSDYTYTSAGRGDVYIKAECSLQSETFVIEDLYRYVPTISPSETITLDDSNLPSNFVMSFTMKTVARSSSVAWGIFNNQYRVGVADSGGYCGIVNHSNGQWITKLNKQLPLNTDKEIICKYENGTWTVSWDNYTISNSNLSTVTTMNSFGTATNMYVSDFKIKPL